MPLAEQAEACSAVSFCADRLEITRKMVYNTIE